MQLPKTYNPKKVEDRIYRFWLKKGFFNPDKLPRRHKKPYTIVIPPPNITGELHMGHALNAIIQDILIRQKRMQGFKTLWLPGIDHAGIATQNVIEKELKKEGKTRFDLGREKFIKRVWQWKEKYGEVILDQFKKLGSSLDWSRKVFTLDKKYCQAINHAFLHYYKKGWIYRGKKVVNWCPRCQTSLSDLELEYEEKKGKLWYIRYPLKIKNQKSKIKNNYIIVATTRPETMLGDMAVAVNPEDKKYKNLVGKKVILPLSNREIPIIADKLVDSKFGTGAVKVTPAHDLTDYEIAQHHNLKLLQVISKTGEMNGKIPLSYQGLKTLKARQEIIKDLKELKLLEKVEDYTHQIPKCYRCRTTIELIPSLQWFLKMEKLAKIAQRPVKKGEIKFYPQRFEKIYFDWLKNVKDWCISRQIWWGHRLPVWHCQTGRISNFQFPISKPKEEYFVSLEKPGKCQICGKCKPKQIPDVLDTWFSSALWPFAVFGWSHARTSSVRGKPKKISDLDRFYPTDVLSTARGIINLWVARMVFSGMELMKKIPFRDVYIHATVLTKEGKRMSKSLGTGIDPLDLIEKYGADATRFGLAYQVMGGQDIRFLEDHIVMGKKFCNKIWNATRFVLQQISKSKIKSQISKTGIKKLDKKHLTRADKKILKELDRTIKSIDKDMENFQFGKAAHTIYNFFWHEFCDKYIEISKSQIVNRKSKKEKEETLKVLLYVLLTSLKLLHPFIPFITEEIYQQFPIKKKGVLMIEEWPKAK